jgi:hypothetical protein
MQSRDNEIWTYAAVTVFTVIGIACVTMIIAQLPSWEDKKPEWIGAIGTIAAFAGTIWIATSESRRRRREELLRARLQAVAMAHRVSNIVLRMDELTRKLHKFFDVTKAETALSYCKYLEKTLSETPLWTVDEAAILVPLPNNTAGRLAKALDSINRVIRLANNAQLNDLEDQELRQQIFDALDHSFSKVKEMLEPADEECSRSRLIPELPLADS